MWIRMNFHHRMHCTCSTVLNCIALHFSLQITSASVKTIDLSSARAKKQKLCGKSSPTTQVAKPPCPILAHGSKEYHEFFKTLTKNFPKSACLMSNQLYSSFIPMSATEVLPKPVMSYRSEESLKLDHEQLMNEC